MVEEKSKILKDLSTPALVKAIEANLIGFWANWGSSPNVEFQKSPDMMRLITGVSHPFMNAVCHAQLTSEDIEERITETLADFKSRQLPMMWLIDTATRPVDLGRHLKDLGLIHETVPGMAIDLQELNEEISVPSGFKIEHVDDGEKLKMCMQATTIGFDLPDFSGDVWFNIEDSLGLDRNLPRRIYIGLLDGEPVASSILFLSAGVAGIYCVSTIPEARRKGIGTVMSLFPLQEARDMDYKVGTLQSSEMALGVYRRLGFKEYCKIEAYIWMPGLSGEQKNS